MVQLQRQIYFPKSFAMGVALLILIFAVGLLLFVYFQGGVDSSIHLSGGAGMGEAREHPRSLSGDGGR